MRRSSPGKRPVASLPVIREGEDYGVLIERIERVTGLDLLSIARCVKALARAGQIRVVEDDGLPSGMRVIPHLGLFTGEEGA